MEPLDRFSCKSGRFACDGRKEDIDVGPDGSLSNGNGAGSGCGGRRRGRGGGSEGEETAVALAELQKEALPDIEDPGLIGTPRGILAEEIDEGG